MTATSRRPDTAGRSLDIAERLVQTRGFNGFSYADVARELAITKASLHYHFPGKAELGVALISRYAARFAAALAVIEDERADARAKLDAYVGIYRAVLSQGRMCLCGILAAEYETLPDAMRAAVTEFFDVNEAWLAAVLSEGQAAGSLSLSEPARTTAAMLLSGLEGAMLIARTHHDPARFLAIANHLLDTLNASGVSNVAPVLEPE